MLIVFNRSENLTFECKLVFQTFPTIISCIHLLFLSANYHAICIYIYLIIFCTVNSFFFFLIFASSSFVQVLVCLLQLVNFLYFKCGISYFFIQKGIYLLYFWFYTSSFDAVHFYIYEGTLYIYTHYIAWCGNYVSLEMVRSRIVFCKIFDWFWLKWHSFIIYWGEKSIQKGLNRANFKLFNFLFPTKFKIFFFQIQILAYASQFGKKLDTWI